jgi:DNA-binding response OmpR family regulator
MKVVIVDDEPTLLSTLDHRLRKEGFSSFPAASAEEASRLFRLVKPDIILLDVNLPGRSGFDFCRLVRRESSVPIIFLTARTAEEDRIEGFELGGDDYITKPFSLAEVVARVRSVLRRSTGETVGETVTAGDLRIDPRTHEGYRGETRLTLSPKEFALLHFMAANSGQVFSREALLDRVWGQDSFVTSRTVDVHVRWLREKIEEDPSSPRRLLTVRGVGYKFVG